MNNISLAILEDMSLNNNGYAPKSITSHSVAKKLGIKSSDVIPEYDRMVQYGHLKLLGKMQNRGEFHCLPEDFDRIVDMFEEMSPQVIGRNYYDLPK